MTARRDDRAEILGTTINSLPASRRPRTFAAVGHGILPAWATRGTESRIPTAAPPSRTGSSTSRARPAALAPGAKAPQPPGTAEPEPPAATPPTAIPASTTGNAEEANDDNTSR